MRPGLAAVVLTVGGAIGLLAFALSSLVDEIDRLTVRNARLELENAGYRSVAAELSEGMAVMATEITELSDRARIDPALLESMEHLPATSTAEVWSSVGEDGALVPSTLSRLRGLLSSLDDELLQVRRGVAFREALAAATPTLYPADGWISGTYGYRRDPFTGERDFHPAVDISTDRGQPVYATAMGRVLSAGRSGAYGNLVELDHGFELVTRYGHLSRFAVQVGDTVQKGQVIGYVGDTGRATGYHVHYEVWSGDHTVNPARLWADPSSGYAN